jgi:hypothetical protein
MTYDLAQLPARMVAQLVESNQLGDDHELASLWFQLSEPQFDPVAIVAVPPMRAESALQLAQRFATLGSAITHQPVLLVSTLGLEPSNAEEAEAAMGHLYEDYSSVILVTDSPTVNAASVPLLNSCARVALAVGMNQSKRPEIEKIFGRLASDNVIGAICLESRPRRRRKGDQPTVTSFGPVPG